jgi:Cft2 family RNA processing exonuclease
MGPYRILLDCGLKNIAPIAEDYARSPFDLVFCSHAHGDHARGLLALHQTLPQLPIYASEVTTQLLALNWPQAAEEDGSFGQALPWRSPIEFRPGLSAELYPAGHLPGAASIRLTYESDRRTYSIFYTGDFLLSNSRLVDGLPLEELRGLKPDVLIVEGSYGTARFPHRKQQENQLAERVDRALNEGRSVLLPSPALGLGQEILMLLRSHHHFTGRDIDIWVEGAVARGCDAYLSLLPHFPSSVQNFARHQPLFWDERVRPRVRRLPERSRTSRTLIQSPCLILTDKVLTEQADFSQYFTPNSGKWLMLIPQQPGRMGSVEAAMTEALQASAALQAVVKSGQVAIETYLLAEHCDGPGTTQLIHNLRPQHVVFVHGSSSYLTDLASLDELNNRYQLHMPAAGTTVSLPIGETFLQPAPPETQYEGELTESEHVILVSLPTTVTSDPRWQNFADTGIVEARWQGEDLVLRGLTQRELLRQSGDALLSMDLECCENCLHCRGQRCWNQASPLFGFKVTPEGYCPVFEALPVTPQDFDQELEGS